VLPLRSRQGPGLVDLLDRAILSHWVTFKHANFSDMRLRKGQTLG